MQSAHHNYRIHLIPEYNVNTDQEEIMSNKAMRKTTAARLNELRNAFEQGEKSFLLVPKSFGAYQKPCKCSELFCKKIARTVWTPLMMLLYGDNIVGQAI